VRCVVLRHTTRVTRCDRQIRVFKHLPSFLSNRPYYRTIMPQSARRERKFSTLTCWAGQAFIVPDRERVGGHAEVSKAEDMQCNAMQRKQHATPNLSRTGIGPEWPRHPEAPTKTSSIPVWYGKSGEGKGIKNLDRKL